MSPVIILPHATTDSSLSVCKGWFLSTRPGNDIFTKATETNPRLLESDPEAHEVIKAYKDGE